MPDLSDVTHNETSAARSSSDHLGPLSEEPHRFTGARLLGLSAFIAMALFWAWAFANANSVEHADRFEDPAFVERAQKVCTVHKTLIEELPLASGAKTPQERAVLIDAATDHLRNMVAELREIEEPNDAKAREIWPQFLSDYDTYIQDRDAWSAKLKEGLDERFILSPGVTGKRVTDLLTNFAEVNDMRACSPSHDV